jgi:hypothetical protein
MSEMETSNGFDRYVWTNSALNIEFRCVEMYTDRGEIELKNPKEPNEPPKVFTFDAIYDWK